MLDFGVFKMKPMVLAGTLLLMVWPLCFWPIYMSKLVSAPEINKFVRVHQGRCSGQLNYQMFLKMVQLECCVSSLNLMNCSLAIYLKYLDPCKPDTWCFFICLDVM
jgi:hypothetical protein